MIYNRILGTALVAGLVAGMFLSNVVFGQSVEERDTASPDGGVQAQPSPAGSQADLPEVSEKIVERTNAFREKHQLRRLKVDPKLTETAQYFADFMARTKKYGHHADDRTPSERVDEHGYEFCIVLENIAYAARSTGFGTRKLTRKFVKGWKNSEGHRENMLDPDVYETGVAVARSEDEPQFFAVQIFGRPQSRAIRFQISNRAGEEVEYTVSRKNDQKKYKLPPRVTRTHTQCRPSRLDLGWTEENEKLAVSDGRRFVVSENEPKGLRITASKSPELAKPDQT